MLGCWKGRDVAASLRFGMALLVVMALAGCGEPGAPQPPSLDLPVPVRNLVATRTGNTVRLAWTATDRTTDRTTPSRQVRVHICRAEGVGPCETVTEQPAKLGQAASYDDTLPTEMLQGPPQLLTYSIELLNHAKKSAGPSNAAYTATGSSVPEVTALTADVRREGVELHWSSSDWLPAGAGAARRLRITRETEGPGTQKVGTAAPATAGKASSAKGLMEKPKELPLQVLEVKLPKGAGAAGGNRVASKDGRALDETALFGRSYRYSTVLVERLSLGGHEVELLGLPGPPARVTTRDVFPPAVPMELAAVADAASRAIDLSWTADSDADLAGYAVYRREAREGAAAVRISGEVPLGAPAFRDARVQAGVTYAYSVSAIDQTGNESARSVEAQETASQP